MGALRFSESDRCGCVASVDTAQIVIEIDCLETMPSVSVGNLIAIETTKAHEYLIAFIERITRKYLDPETNAAGEVNIDLPSSSDFIKVNIIGTFLSVDGERHDVFKRGVDSFPQIDSKCFCISSQNLQNFMNILGSNIDIEKRLKIGTFSMDKTAEAILDGNKFFQRHAAVLGSTGSGKSWCVAGILEKASHLQYPNLIVFDMHGEYSSLSSGTNRIADGFRIAGPGDLGKDAGDILYMPYWVLNRDEVLSMILDRSDYNAPNQASRFTTHIQTLKKGTIEKEHLKRPYESFTVDSPIPYDLSQLIALLNDDNTRKGEGTKGQPIKGDWEGQLTRFLARLDAKIADKRYGFMFQPPVATLQYNWLADQLSKILGFAAGQRGIKIIDFSEVPSDVLPVITGTMARLLYDIQFWLSEDKRTPFTLVCDEAHLYLPTKDDADSVQKQALYNFERIAKEGRKYGVSILAVSQRPSDVSRTILSQCNNFIVLRLTNENDKSVIKNLLPDSLKSTIESLPLLDVGEALVVGDAIMLPSKIQLSPPSEHCRPVSATHNFWNEWDSKQPNNDAIRASVEAMRRQSRT